MIVLLNKINIIEWLNSLHYKRNDNVYSFNTKKFYDRYYEIFDKHKVIGVFSLNETKRLFNQSWKMSQWNKIEYLNYINEDFIVIQYLNSKKRK